MWRKSSYSAGNGGECVELAAHRGRLLIRDSKHPAEPSLNLPGVSARTLFAALRRARG
ncbi:DUF397 domain-containing protein [Actinocorallia lasiicapitis]